MCKSVIPKNNTVEDTT